MADKKISQLTALSAANLAPSTDVLAIVDTSATETKKIAAQDIVNGVLNVASAVGIGTASPEALLTVSKQSSGGEGGYIYIDNPAASALNNKAGIKFGTSSGASFSTFPTGEITNVVTNAGNGASDLAFGTFNGTSSGTRMTLDASGNLLVGTTSGGNRLVVSNATDISMSSGAAGQARFEGNGYSFAIAMNADAAALYTNSAARGIIFGTDETERGRFTAAGLFLVNIDTSSGYGGAHRIYRDVAEGDFILSVDGGGEYAALFSDVAGANYSTNACAIRVGRNSSTLRSINAGGTVNASGADYAEYMTKAGDFAIAKGDVCGVNADGKLTNVFADAVSFVVKSTDPSYVGGDSWGSAEAIGLKMPDSDASEEEKDIFNAAIEAARQKVDRIAFAGQVPVNVLGATPGQYIVPVNDSGAIKGVAVSNPTFEQYQSAVGKVIAVQDDGRALIIVKVA